MYLTYWQRKDIRERPGAVEHQVKLRSTRQTEEPSYCGAKLPPHLPLHVPQRTDNTHSQGHSDCAEHIERMHSFKLFKNQTGNIYHQWTGKYLLVRY